MTQLGERQTKEPGHQYVDDYLLEFCKFSLSCVPNLDSINIRPNQVFKMCCQRTAIDLWPTASLSNPLGDVKYDACEAILVNPYFLIVGNLPQFAMEG